MFRDVLSSLEPGPALARTDSAYLCVGALLRLAGKELARLLSQHPSLSVLLGCQDEAEHEDGRMRTLARFRLCRLQSLVDAESPLRTEGVLPLELLDLDSVHRFAAALPEITSSDFRVISEEPWSG